MSHAKIDVVFFDAEYDKLTDAGNDTEANKHMRDVEAMVESVSDKSMTIKIPLTDGGTAHLVLNHEAIATLVGIALS